MNNINNKLISKEEVESIVNNYINFYYESKTKSDPFNLNKYILPKEQKRTWFCVNNIELIQKAFIHKSFWNNTNTFDESDACSCLNLKREDFGDYEKLEFRGDKVIDLITLDYIIGCYPDKEVGFLTELKSNIVKKPSLANLGEQLGFKKYILFSSHIDRITNAIKSSGRENKRFLEDIFESFIGALYIDQNFDKEIIKPFLLGVFKKHIDLAAVIKNEINYKSTLLKFFHIQKFGHPKYIDLYFLGPPTQRTFVSIVLVEKETFFNDESIVCKNEIAMKTLSDLFNGYLDFLGKKNNDIINQQDQIQLFNYNGERVTPYDWLFEKINYQGYIFVGIGEGEKKQIAEKECSKNCLYNLQELKN
jgi:ribonuclease-3